MEGISLGLGSDLAIGGKQENLLLLAGELCGAKMQELVTRELVEPFLAERSWRATPLSIFLRSSMLSSPSSCLTKTFFCPKCILIVSDPVEWLRGDPSTWLDLVDFPLFLSFPFNRI